MLDINLGTGGGNGDTTKEIVRKLVLNQREAILRLSRQERFPFDPTLSVPRTAAETFTKAGFTVAALASVANVQIANGIIGTATYYPMLVRLDATTVLVCAFTASTTITVTLVRINAATGAITVAATTTITTGSSRSLLAGVAISADKAILLTSVPDTSGTKVAQYDTYEITVDRTTPAVTATTNRARTIDAATFFAGSISTTPRLMKSGVNSIAVAGIVHGSSASGTNTPIGPAISTFYADSGTQGAQVDSDVLHVGGGDARPTISHDFIGDGGILVAYGARGVLKVAVAKVTDGDVRVTGTLTLPAVASLIYVYAISASVGLVCWYDGSTYRAAFVRVDDKGVPQLSGFADSGTRAAMQPYGVLIESDTSFLGLHFAATTAAALSARPRSIAADGTVSERTSIALNLAATASAAHLDMVRLSATDALMVYRETSTTGVNLRLETLRMS